MNDKARKDWKMISNFIFNTEKQDFRSQLNQVNQDLYLKIKDLALKMVNKRLTSPPKRRAESQKKFKIVKKEIKINIREVTRDSEESDDYREEKDYDCSVISPLIKMVRNKTDTKRERDLKRQMRAKEKHSFENELEELAHPLLKPIK